MSLSSQHAEVLSPVVLGYLHEFDAVTPYLHDMVRSSVLRLLDSQMIIEDSLEGPVAVPEPDPPVAAYEDDFSEDIGAIVAGVEHDGLAPHFGPLMRSFARILFRLFATESQHERVRSWVKDGYRSSFLMTDRGGPTLSSWHSELAVSEGRMHLKVDKIWAMHAHEIGFAIISVRYAGAMFPLAFLVSPEECRKLKCTKVGPPFLDGILQLGNAAGFVAVEKEDRIVRAGPATINRQLTICRPFFVSAVMAHLDWLAGHNRAAFSDRQASAIASIGRMAQAIIKKNAFSSFATRQVLALKFLSNELLLELVASGAIDRAEDQRDLLAFTKMEGSSYRCFHELYRKTRG